MATRLPRLLGAGLALALAAGLLVAGPASGGPVTEIVLVHDTHVHGNLESGLTNIAQKAYVINQIRAQNANVIFVGNGDDLGTSLLSSVFHGRHVVETFNTMGLAADTFGNHDFDEGPDNTLTQVQASQFPWVTANVRDKATGAVFGAAVGVKSYVIREIAGVKIGLTGVAPLDTPTISSPGPNVVVLDPAKALAEVVPQMRQAGAQVVVLLSHLDGTTAEAVVKQVAGIDLVVGDHAAQILDQPLQIGSTYLSRVGDEFKAVGEVHLFVAGGKLDHISFTKHDLLPETPADPVVAALVQGYHAQLSAALGEVVGYTMAPLNGIKADNRWRETLLGDVTTDIMRQATGADVAILNGGGLRADRIFPKGPITRGDVQTAFPFTNYVVKLRVTGQQIQAALENGVSQVTIGGGRFLQVSGLSYRYDAAAAPSNRVSQILVGGQALDLNAHYTMATVEFLANGGDGADMLKTADVLLSASGGPLLSTLVSDHLGYIYPQPLTRIRIAKVDFVAGKGQAFVGGAGHNLPAKPFMQDGALWLPVRFVGELYGAHVLWTGNGVQLVVGGKTVAVTGHLVDSTFYVPAVDLANVLGLQVEGNGEKVTLVDNR